MTPNSLTILLMQQLGPYGWKLFVDYQNKDKAKKQFVSLFQEQLRQCDVQDWEIKSLHTPQVEKFLGSRSLKVILDRAFEPGFKGFDPLQIAKLWSQQDRSKLPSEFDWNLLLKHYGERVREIKRRDLDLREILNSEISEDVTIKLKSIGSISPGFNLKGYRKNLKDNYGSLNLNAFDRQAGEQIDLSAMFVEQRVREDLVSEEQQEDVENSGEPILKVLAAEKCLHAVVVGDPGSGKSTLLRYLALGWTEDKRERFPIIIDIREYALERSQATSIETEPTQHFLEFLELGMSTGWKFNRSKLDEYLQHQPSLVMFDGLDEILVRDVWERVVAEIANFALRYPLAKIIVTSQSAGYDPERLHKANFRHFTLQKFDRAQIGEFIDKWYDLVLGKDPEKDRLRLQIETSIQNSPAIRKLAENPSRLTMVAMSNRRKSSILGRTEFYEEALRGLLHKWDMDRQNANPELDSIGRVEKQAMLQLIAYEIQSTQTHRPNSSQPLWKRIDRDRLKTILTDYLEQERFVDPSRKAESIVQQLVDRHFISIDTQTNSYGFIDRTFLEYCYASEIVGRFEKKKSAEEFERLEQDVFAAHWQDESWHEILQSICGLLEPQWAGRLVEFLADRPVDRVDYLDKEKRATKLAFQHLQLAKECLAEIKNGRAITAKIEQSLKERLKHELLYRSATDDGISLNFVAAQLLTNLLVQPLQGRIADDNRAAAPVDPSVKWIEECALQSRHKFVRAAAVQAIGEHCHTKTDTLKWLQERATSDRHELVRRAAVESIGTYYHQLTDTLAWLQERAMSDRHELVRRAAVQSIGEYYDGEGDTFKWLQDRASRAQHEWIRVAAVQSIAKYYYRDGNTLKYIQDLVTSDRHKLVRGAAMRSIAQCYRSKLVLNWLKTCAVEGKSEDIRRVAVQSIAKYHHGESTTLKCLEDRALCDRHEQVRVAAVRSISQYYSAQPHTLTWLKARVLHAQHQVVRLAAVQSIGEYYHAQPDALAWLRSIADIYPDVRLAVVESIAKYDRQNPQTLAWLQDRAIDYTQHQEVRVAAVRAVAAYYRPQPDTLAWLKSIALDGKQHRSVRQAAVKSVGESDRQNPQTLAWLQARAIDVSQPEDVKAAAVQSIALYHHSQPDTLPWLKAFTQVNNEHKLLQQTAIHSIAKYYRPEDTLNWLAHAFHPHQEHAQQAAVKSISEYYYNEPDTLNWLQDSALDEDRQEIVRQTTVKSIAERYYTQSDLLPWLQERAMGDRDPLVRQASIQSVAKYYYNEPTTLSWLQDRTMEGNQPEVVKSVAVQSIAKYYPNSDTLIWLKSLATHNQDLVVKQSAIGSIAQYYYTEPDTLKWLKSVALEPSEDAQAGSLQRAAVESIAKYSHQEPNTLQWLKAPAISDPDRDVRVSAVEAIATYYHTKPGTLKWLKARSIDDPDRDVRTAATREIAKYYAPKSETLQSLQALALEDSDRDVRTAAVESIAESYRKQPKTLIWLQEQALTAQHKDVRRAAIGSIAGHYRQDPDVLNWLQDRAIDSEHSDVGAAVVESVAQNYAKLSWLQAVALDETRSKEVKIAAVKSIAQHYRKEPDTLKWFQAQALTDKEGDPGVRLGAVAAIVKYYRRQPVGAAAPSESTLKWLKTSAVKAHHPDVRAAAAVSIAKYYRSDPNTIAWLKDRAVDAPPQLVLRAIVGSIAKYYQSQSNTLIWLKNRAIHAPDRSLRGETILAVSKYYHHQPGTYPWLKERALKDRDGLVRAISIESIAKNYHKELHPLIWPKALGEKISAESVEEASNRLEWLTTALKDPDGLVRASAVISLAKYYHMHPHTPAWLKQRAVEDPDGLIRAAAVKSIVKYYHKHSDTLEWLKDRDLYDEHEAVRVEVLVSLAKYYHQDPDTFSWLGDHALDDQDRLVRSSAIRALEKYFPISNEMYKILRLVVDRDLDRDYPNEMYPKQLALKILVEKCGYTPPQQTKELALV